MGREGACHRVQQRKIEHTRNSKPKTLKKYLKEFFKVALAKSGVNREEARDPSWLSWSSHCRGKVGANEGLC